ncbi:MAG TPA: hypothetical protein VFO54_04995, partial [Chryseosolibacter sp.]|nr:hypothetical protein [Chryseosolibacter sp.]
TLSDGECAMTSLHPRLNVMMNPVDLAYFDAEHDDHHLVKISEIQLALAGAVIKSAMEQS